MKKLLITGFEPFNEDTINPSWEALKLLPSKIKGYEITKLLIPVVFGKAAETVIEKAEELCPDVILSVGQAGGRSAVTPELVGINLRHGNIPDNNGYQPNDEPIDDNGTAAYFSTLPVRRMSEAVNARGIKSAVSYSAGAYVCNDLLYSLLRRYEKRGVRVGFIHIPYCREQNKEPSMTLKDIATALIAAIESIDD